MDAMDTTEGKTSKKRTQDDLDEEEDLDDMLQRLFTMSSPKAEPTLLIRSVWMNVPIGRNICILTGAVAPDCTATNFLTR